MPQKQMPKSLSSKWKLAKDHVIRKGDWVCYFETGYVTALVVAVTSEAVIVSPFGRQPRVPVHRFYCTKIEPANNSKGERK